MKTVNLTEDEHAELLKLRAAKKLEAAEVMEDNVVRAAGTSEGVRKSWQTRMKHGEKLSSAAFKISHRADKSGKEIDHHDAMRAHEAAGNHWHSMEQDHKKDSSLDSPHGDDTPFSEQHEFYAEHHRNEGHVKEDYSIGASDTTSTEVIHCRASSAAGEKLGASAPWQPGQTVSFMWMPAGVSTICAGFRKGSIELTVACDEATAEAVQASLEGWRNERPKQEPFGCVEHREQEASFRISASGGFKWNGDGVYLAAEPTTLGAQNVNGKVHRSWSPSFTTDADYSKATEHDGVLQFPEGVRGSRSNPAQITGVDFCVGTLTNKPAFHSMSPVRSREAVMASGTSEGVKKSWETRHKLGEHEVNLPVKVELWRRHEKGKHQSSFGGLPFDKEEAVVEGVPHQVKVYKSSMSGKHELGSMTFPNSGIIEKLAKQQHGDNVEVASWSYNRIDDAADLVPKEKVKASDTTPSSTITAHCKENLLRDVPDATKAEIAAYEQAIDEGGSHGDAVYELRKERKNGFVSSQDWEDSSFIKATWSDAARKAAIEARKSKAQTHAEFATTIAGGKHVSTKVGYGAMGNEIAVHEIQHHDPANAAESFHEELTSGSNAGANSPQRVHKPGTSSVSYKTDSGERHIFNFRKKEGVHASEPTLDSIVAKVNASLTTANQLAEDNGVAKLTAQDVYERHSVRAAGTNVASEGDLTLEECALAAKWIERGARLRQRAVMASGTSEGVRKAWQTRLSGHGFEENQHGGMTHKEMGMHVHEKDGVFRVRGGGEGSKSHGVGYNTKNIEDIIKHVGRESNKASDASILESIYARAGANR